MGDGSGVVIVVVWCWWLWWGSVNTLLLVVVVVVLFIVRHQDPADEGELVCCGSVFLIVHGPWLAHFSSFMALNTHTHTPPDTVTQCPTPLLHQTLPHTLTPSPNLNSRLPDTFPHTLPPTHTVPDAGRLFPTQTTPERGRQFPT